jgi:uncharacterized protein with LGFP repeats
VRISKLPALVLFATTILFVSAANACVPYGFIGVKWRSLGSTKSPLGNCVDDEKDDGAGGRIETFQNGWIDWDGRGGQAYAVYGLIGQKWRQLGLARFGHPITDETGTPDRFGRYNYFRSNTGGVSTIYFSPRSWWCVHERKCVAYVVYGAILVEWARQGYERGRLGYPESDEDGTKGYGSVPGERGQYFEHGRIIWRPDGSILDKLSSDSCQLETGSYLFWDEHHDPDKFCPSL